MESSALLFALVAVAFVGIILAFWQRAASAKAEKAPLDRRIVELTTELTGVRAELTQAQAESAARAGFESLASERDRTIAQLMGERDGFRAELQAKAEAENRSTARIKELETELRNERQNMAEKLALLDTAKKALADQFEALAADILERKTKSFSEGSETELGRLLTPLKDQIKEFREKVEQAQTDSKTGVTRLETLIGTLGGLNQKLSEEAHNLTTALRGSSKDQGDWGEDVARDLLELGGLHEGVQYRTQQTFEAPANDDAGPQRNLRPDFVIDMPGGRSLIIDSKVSLKAYADFVNEENQKKRSEALDDHLKSIRRHVDELSAKSYHKIQSIESPDFVIMFVPIEPAFLVSINKDRDLWRYAYEKEVLLVGPTTLLFVIRIVKELWQQELQERNVEEVMERGTRLYDKFVGFINDMDAIGESLRGASGSYEDAKKKLCLGDGNLVRQVEMLRELGVKPKPKRAIPLKWLAAAEVGDAGLTLAANAEEESAAE